MGDHLGTAGVVGLFFFFFYPFYFFSLLTHFFCYFFSLIIPFYLRFFHAHFFFFSFAYTFFQYYSTKTVIVAWKISQMFYSFSRLTQKGELVLSKHHKVLLEYTSCLRPYHTEYTGSRLITEVKQCQACSVLGWVTAWEQQVL